MTTLSRDLCVRDSGKIASRLARLLNGRNQGGCVFQNCTACVWSHFKVPCLRWHSSTLLLTEKGRAHTHSRWKRNLLYFFFFLIIKCRQIVCYEVLINSWWVIQLSFCFDFDLKFETFNKLVKTPFDTCPVWIDRRAKIVVVAVEVMQLRSSSWKAIVRVG